MTAPDARPGGLDSNMRGLVVLVVAVLVGVLLLANAGGGDSGSTKTTSSAPPTTGSLGTDDTTATTKAGSTSTTAATTGRQPSEVTVIVLNGGGPAGSAASTTKTIADAGYTTLAAANAPANVDATTVYYDTDYKAEGTSIALLLGKDTDAVKPVSDGSVGTEAGDANVVVVLGPDTAPVSDGSTTTTAAGSTTTTN